ncbi:hypothetical protein GDO81_002995 [Engystomops pustulosus]|uniref:Uncharacterized protein n=1 Tax=Engystomops pustulosus TaxID=76066 RepID=A0AAV7A236_ENGPU|nr:hypothetical protein GDO81_002995 [Engystomops pustulosus]
MGDKCLIVDRVNKKKGGSEYLCMKQRSHKDASTPLMVYRTAEDIGGHLLRAQFAFSRHVTRIFQFCADFPCIVPGFRRTRSDCGASALASTRWELGGVAE